MDNIDEIKSYIFLSIPELNECGRCASCCDSFGNNGPKVQEYEREKIIDNLISLGFEAAAKYVKTKGAIPTKPGEPVSRECIMLEDNYCRLQELGKPDVCNQTPNWLYMFGNDLIFQVDIYGTGCRGGMNMNELESRIESLDLEQKYGVHLKFRIATPIEERYRRFYGEE